MTGKRHSYVPSMSDAAVNAKTGRDWAQWFGVLDAAIATQLDHRSIVTLLSQKYAAPSWWRQMIAVEYERARGLRARHETSSGYSVAISKTVAVSLSHLYAQTADTAKRKKWFPKGAFVPSSRTRDKYLRGSWKAGARLEIGFYAKGRDKSQIVVQVNKLAGTPQVERERTAWKSALSKLQRIVED